VKVFMLEIPTLTKDERSERLRACLKVEMRCSELYSDLCMLFPKNLFPETKNLFLRLKKSEDEHANILRINLELHKTSDMPMIPVPYTLPLLKKTLNIVDDIQFLLGKGKVNLKTILNKTLEMEESSAESYLREIMVQQTDKAVVAYLRQFYTDEKSHVEIIKEFIHKRNLSHS
jgi:rubrerythrin